MPDTETILKAINEVVWSAHTESVVWSRMDAEEAGNLISAIM
jgi:hypothetical protein